tara:strand:+ start:332 stop:517 length:186 start_codon:yes stop_codon:yes gene_type:complete
MGISEFIALIVIANGVQLFLNEKGAVARAKALAERLKEMEDKFERDIDRLMLEIQQLEWKD